MAQGEYNPYQTDSAVSEETGGEKTSFLSKLKDKTKQHGRKLKTKLHKTGSDNSGETGESGDDENDSETVQNDTTGSAFGQPEQKDDPTPAEGDGDASGLSKDFEGLSTNEKPAGGVEGDQAQDSDKPVTQSVQDNVSSAADQTKSAVGVGGADDAVDSSEQESADAPSQTSVADQAKTAVGVGGAAGAVDSSEQEPSDASSQGADAGKTWTQWASQKIGVTKDTATANAPTTDDGTPIHQKAYDTVTANAPTTADGTPIHHKAYDTAVGAKDSAYGTAVGAKDSVASQIPDRSSIPSDPAQQTYFQKATGAIYGAKDSVASQIPERSSIPSDPAQQTYFQKAAGGIYGAKDTLFSATQPGDHHKALSQQVTESVGNLPATLKSSLGFGKGGSDTATTTTPGAADGEASGAPPQSPGIVSRITGLFGSKKPATEESTPSTEPPTSGGSEDSTQVPESS